MRDAANHNHAGDETMKKFNSIGWKTKKVGITFAWRVTGFIYGEGTTVLASGSEITRARAAGKAKKACLRFRRNNN